MLVTRLRPTPYADAHLGHAWVAWHNWVTARNAGGKFLLIFDDLTYYLPTVVKQSWSFTTARERYLEDLDWLGLAPDEWHISTVNAEHHAWAAEKLGIIRPAMGGCIGYIPLQLPEARGNTALGYHPWLVVARVVDDYLYGVTGFYRGEDLHGEIQLYDYFRRTLYPGPTVGQTYLPVIRREESPSKESKSNNEGVSIRDLRDAGYHPEDVLETLCECGRRSAAAFLRDTVIPAGILERDVVRTLPYNDANHKHVYLTDTPWRDECLLYWRRMKGRNRRAREGRKKGGG